MSSDYLALTAAGVVFLTFIGLFYRMFLKNIFHEMKDMFTWFRKFQRDWDGEAAEPGRDATPGVMQRLNRIDGELQRNGGDSLKDKVVETWEMTNDLSKRVDIIELKQIDIEEAVSELK